jgi:hypothetical protein
LTLYQIQDSHPLTKCCSICCKTLTEKHVCFERKTSSCELELQIRKPDEVGNIKTEVFEEKNYSEPLQEENKKIKEEFVLEKINEKQKPPETKEINIVGWNNEVTLNKDIGVAAV